MAEAASPSRKRKPQITELEMEAAQHLIQLSEDSSSSSSDNINAGKRNISACDDGEEVHERKSHKSVAKKIREIFGEDEVSKPKKKKRRRYRSLVNIYMATTSSISSMLQGE